MSTSVHHVLLVGLMAAAILASATFIMIPTSIIPNQPSAFATFLIE